MGGLHLILFGCSRAHRLHVKGVSNMLLRLNDPDPHWPLAFVANNFFDVLATAGLTCTEHEKRFAEVLVHEVAHGYGVPDCDHTDNVNSTGTSCLMNNRSSFCGGPAWIDDGVDWEQDPGPLTAGTAVSPTNLCIYATRKQEIW